MKHLTPLIPVLLVAIGVSSCSTRAPVQSAPAPAPASAPSTVSATVLYPAGTVTHKELLAQGGTAPRVLFDSKPQYTPGALQRRVNGSVTLEGVVLPSGSPGFIRVTRSLDPELDDSAKVAFERWRFTPGMLNGRVVPVILEVEMSFATR